MVSDPNHSNTGLQVKPVGRVAVCYFRNEFFP